ncbi:MAG TPA: PKD domain-containing protein [Saprospiraceae bacterium]|nr:PKD domain-containing protein [Saprospiraceae bacterium]HNJ18001.1 PKD domain-containing protein [Saprospiraceae bacterium]
MNTSLKKGKAIRLTILALIMVLFMGVPGFCQNYDYAWLMGTKPKVLPAELDTANNNFIIDFKNDSFKLIKSYETMTNMFLECNSLCDSSGTLLMYTNGCAVFDATGNILPNGDSINYYVDGGNNAWVPSCGKGEKGYPLYRGTRFVPLFSHNRIFLLHTAASDEGNVFSYRYILYTEIEKKEGVWTVVNKNILLHDKPKVGVRYDITKHANGRDWWLVAQNIGLHEYFVYLISPDGIKLQKTQNFPIPSAYTNTNPTFSPDGSKFFQYTPAAIKGDSWLFDFDRITGTLSDPVIVHHPKSMFGQSSNAPFSPSGRFLYMCDVHHLYQVDLWDSDTLTNRDTISVWDGLVWPCKVQCRTSYYTLQPGPDGKIYCGSDGASSYFFHVIERPNEKGKACMFRPRAYRTPFYYHTNMPIYPYYRLGPIDGSAADTLGINNVPVAKFRYYPDSVDWHKIEFVDNSYYNPTDWYWDFGDGSGNSSTEVNPIYSYAKSGVYDVCLTVSNVYGSDTYCRYVRVGTVSTTVPNADRYMKLYPNPATNSINIELGEKLSGGHAYTIHCYDLLGRRCYTGVLPAYSYLHTIDVSGFAPGMYFIELTDGVGNKRVEKFVRE